MQTEYKSTYKKTQLDLIRTENNPNKKASITCTPGMLLSASATEKVFRKRFYQMFQRSSCWQRIWQNLCEGHPWMIMSRNDKKWCPETLCLEWFLGFYKTRVTLWEASLTLLLQCLQVGAIVMQNSFPDAARATCACTWNSIQTVLLSL